MKTRAKRCTVKGQSVDPAKAPAHAPTDEKLSDGQNADHYVLCPEDRAKGYVEPFRIDYIHEKCGGVTTMPRACAETYAVQPSYYGSTFCCTCGGYFPVGADGEFIWNDGSRQKVGTRRAACAPTPPPAIRAASMCRRGTAGFIAQVRHVANTSSARSSVSLIIIGWGGEW